MKPMTPRILLVLERADGSRAQAVTPEGLMVTSDMLDAAEDLLHTLTTGERPVIKNLYDLAARAFNTTREDAKERLAAAAYGMSPRKIEANSEALQDARDAELARLTSRDRRRIADGDRALALPEPQGPAEISDQLEIIRDGILALQSLDDIGEEGNRRAHENFCTLEKRYGVLKARLGATKTARR